ERAQSIADGPFHWQRTTDGRVLRWRTDEAFDFFDGSHDGYAPVEHRRRVLSLHGEMLIVADLLHGGGEHDVMVHWHVDPRWTATPGPRSVALTDGTRSLQLLVPHGSIECFRGDTRSGLGWHSPVYGRIEPATTVRIRDRGATPRWLISVFDLKPSNAVLDAIALPVWADAGSLAHGAALRLTRAESTDYVLFAEPAASPGEASPPSMPRPRPEWRVGRFITDPRMLLARLSAQGRLRSAALGDGSFLRDTRRRGVSVTLGREVAAISIGETQLRSSSCAASPAS